jgi:Arc/MetJ-type ribon-helix-helix transcriptional regulator
MTVTLSKRTEEIVQAQLKTGRYATPDEVVNRLIEQQLPTEAAPEFPPGPDEAELKSSLLAAVSKPTRPYRKGEFVELAQRVIAEERGA